ncbi:hypothetical protein KY326_00755 [Candidatus Woesearchaeota archaeon]|nr:hypothetical protein [Candidatus Woesearchaeota archaeon]
MTEEENHQIGKRLEEKAVMPDGVGNEYRVSAVKGLGFVKYLGKYRESQIGLNTTSDSDRTIPALHEEYIFSLWRFAEKAYSSMKYRTLPIEESELDRLTDPEEDSWLEKWFAKIEVEDEETKDTFYRKLFSDQILAAKFVLGERGYKIISGVEQQEKVQSGHRNLRWWIVGAAAVFLLIGAGSITGAGYYVYKNYISPFVELQKKIESGEIIDDIIYKIPRQGITDDDIDRIKDGFRKLTPEERRELFFGVPPAKKEDKKEEKAEATEEKKESEEKTEEKKKPSNESQREESDF